MEKNVVGKKRRGMSTRKRIFIGYAPKDWSAVWTVFNTLNIAFVIQKTRQEAYIRYGNDDLAEWKNIKKIRITIEELEPKGRGR